MFQEVRIFLRGIRGTRPEEPRRGRDAYRIGIEAAEGGFRSSTDRRRPREISDRWAAMGPRRCYRLSRRRLRFVRLSDIFFQNRRDLLHGRRQVMRIEVAPRKL